ncbi:MAG: U32 family peptidase [Oscillospiraceae bacterium]|nr:U32 family peptidase [Oscillospiraceae bacterium]
MAELLCPAGGRDSLIAAVQCGADAVYMGFGAFNARRNAKNFTDEEYHEAVRYCHERGVKVFLTLNTLLTDREMEAAADALRRASEMGVDAVLVQDWGVLTLAREVAPDLPVHASTQMSIHTLGGAQYAADLGMERVVLSRELNKEEIAEICRGCSAEVEAFVHGALCMCYSGQCTMSALIGQRSGNRGACAQPCRLPYGVNGPCRGEHPLSLKDMNLSTHLGEMEEMGLDCLKLEGRMKRPEYVAVITHIYRRLLEEHRGPTTEERVALEQAFSRSGFTEGYYLGKKGPKMFGTRPENTPEPKELFAWARTLYEKEDRRTVPVTMEVALRSGEAASLTVSDGANTLTVTGDVPETARNRALTEEEVSQRLSKTGGTAYRCEQVNVVLDEGLMMSAGALNGLRREALEQLAARRTAPPLRHENPTPELPEETAGEWCDVPALTVSIARAEQLTEELVSQCPEMIYVPFELLGKVDLRAYTDRTKFCAVLPRIFRTRDEEHFRAVLKKTEGLSAVAVGNLGHLPIVEGLGLEVRGDFGMNVFNSRALAFMKDCGFNSATVSFELRHQQVRDLAKYLPCEAVVYGRLPLMIMENCPIGNAGNCHGDKRLCEGENTLTDRTGARFPMMGQYGCRCEIENSMPVFLADKEEWKRCGLRWARLRFTTESPRECVEILRSYREGGNFNGEFTRGLFYRGVE